MYTQELEGRGFQAWISISQQSDTLTRVSSETQVLRTSNTDKFHICNIPYLKTLKWYLSSSMVQKWSQTFNKIKVKKNDIKQGGMNKTSLAYQALTLLIKSISQSTIICDPWAPIRFEINEVYGWWTVLLVSFVPFEPVSDT